MEYFTSLSIRGGPQQRRWFHGAMDALLDASHAAAEFDQAIGGNRHANLLVCYGFLQALYVQQDAVSNLSRAVGLVWRPNSNDRLLYIRGLRNRLCGHPASADRQENKLRPSTAIIPAHSVTKHGFQGAIYYDDGYETVSVPATELLRENESILAGQLNRIEEEMDRIERLFRREQAERRLSHHFGVNFGYIIQGLVYGKGYDSSRKEQAASHVQMVRDCIVNLRQDLRRRDLEAVFHNSEFEKILAGLSFLEEKLSLETSTQADNFEYDLLFRGLKSELEEIQKRIDDLDYEFKIEL